MACLPSSVPVVCLAVLLHLLFSTFLWMPSYYSKLWENSDTAIMPLINGTQVDKFGFMKSEWQCDGWCVYPYCPADCDSLEAQSCQELLAATRH
jgi:hypothetical protein